MSMYLGDVALSQVLYFKFTTNDSNDVPTTLSSATVKVFKGSNTTASTAGVTVTPDFSSVTGIVHVAVDTSADAAFYATGNDFSVIMTSGVIAADSLTFTSALAEFSINNRTALRASTSVTMTISNVNAVSTVSNVNAVTTVSNVNAVTTVSNVNAVTTVSNVNAVTTVSNVNAVNTVTNVNATAITGVTIEGSYTLQHAMRIALAALAGKLSGAATTSIAIRDTGDTKDRIVATVDATGNRTAITLDAT